MEGYYIVDPGLALPEYHLSCDIQAQCLAYLINKIKDQFATEGIFFTVIPVNYLGPGYPAIGMTTADKNANPSEMTRLSFRIGDRLSSDVEQMGLDNLVKKAASENLTWREIQERSELTGSSST